MLIKGHDDTRRLLESIAKKRPNLGDQNFSVAAYPTMGVFRPVTVPQLNNLSFDQQLEYDDEDSDEDDNEEGEEEVYP